MIREFHLSPRGQGGISCDEDGAFVGSIPILRRLQRNGTYEWQPRDCDGLSEQMSAQYALPIDMSPKAGGLKAIAKALNDRDVARAQIATVLLGVPDPLPLSKGASSRQQLIKLVRDLHWSGMLKWVSDEHPRWPEGSPDSTGGRFAPKDAEAGISDAANGAPWLVPVADVEDESHPRFGVGGNRLPLDELMPERLQQSPAAPVVQFLDNLLDISGPAEEANLGLYTAQMHALLQAIHDVDPDYVYESVTPLGGLAGMSWQERRNVINGLQADLAAAIYRVRGGIRPLQEVTLEFMQRATNAAYDKGIKLYDAGDLDFQLSREATIGNYVDARVREQLKDFFNDLEIPTDSGSTIRVNNRAYISSGSGASYRLPDARIGNFAFDVSLEAKKPSKPQIKDFFSANFEPIGVVIIRPNQLGSNSSYVIWRRDGE